MKNTWIKIAAAVTAVVFIAGIAQAVPVTGNIGFTGQAVLDSTSVNTATAVTAWNNTTVNGGSGSFALIPALTPALFTAPWSFNSGALPSLWSTAGFTFDLIASSIIINSSGVLFVTGTGTVSGNLYDPTLMNWSFSAQDPNNGQSPQTFTFSASATTPTPDGGTTMMLLGGALMGLGFIKRKLSA